MRMLRWKVLVAALLAVVPVLPAAAQTRIEPGFNLLSVDQDVQIGQQNAAQIEHQMPMLNDAALTSYVTRVGQRLAAHAPGAKYPYRFRVVNLSDINAFALPGGFIYVDRGTIQAVHSEGELAGVMAHEIAHVALRHPTNQISHAYIANAGLGLLGALVGSHVHSATSAQLLQAASGLGMNLMFLKFSRTAESQADVVGSQIMARAGYDPNEMANFFETLRRTQGSDPGKVAQFLSDHPAPVNREARVREEARMLSIHRTAPVGGLVAAQGTLRRLPPAPSMAQVTPRG